MIRLKGLSFKEDLFHLEFRDFMNWSSSMAAKTILKNSLLFLLIHLGQLQLAFNLLLLMKLHLYLVMILVIGKIWTQSLIWAMIGNIFRRIANRLHQALANSCWPFVITRVCTRSIELTISMSFNWSNHSISATSSTKRVSSLLMKDSYLLLPKDQLGAQSPKPISKAVMYKLLLTLMAQRATLIFSPLLQRQIEWSC